MQFEGSRIVVPKRRSAAYRDYRPTQDVLVFT